MAKKKNPLGFVEKMKKLHTAGLANSPPANRTTTIDPDLPSLSERVEKLMGLMKLEHQNSLSMIYFVMYDIENNKVRTQVVKYLIKKGCTRVQKSIFLANTRREVFDQIRTDLREVQACYENNDSIILVPVSTDEIKAMNVIGQNIDFDLILQNRNTLFF